MSQYSPRAKTLGLVALALVAFAANSLLCRMALGHQAIDPASFTLLRLGSGALMLALLANLRRDRPVRLRPDWPAALALAVYMAAFSFAYLWLDAGRGALILFGAVQFAMFGVVLLAEPLDVRLLLSAAAVLGGVALTLRRGGPTRPAVGRRARFC